MTQENVIDLLSAVTIVAAIFSNLAFLIAYALLIPNWRRGPMSRTIVTWAAMVLLLLISLLYHEIALPSFRQSPYWVSWTDIALTAMVAAAATWRTVVLRQEVRDGDRQ